MARSLGIPARVAVGFTPGCRSPTAVASVLGSNAHAWPEVWFDGIGWVPFEPTPGRGAPGAESLHRASPPAQDESVAAARPRRRRQAVAAAVPTTPRRPPTIPQSDSSPEPARRRPRRRCAVTVPTRTGGALSLGDPRHAGGLLVLAAPELVRRWRRRHPDPDVARRSTDLWTRALGAVEATGFRADPIADADRAGARGGAPPAGGGPTAEVAGRADHAATFAPADEVAELIVADDRRRAADRAAGPARSSASPPTR